MVGADGRDSCSYYSVAENRMRAEVTMVLCPQGSPSGDLPPPARPLPPRFCTASPNKTTCNQLGPEGVHLNLRKTMHAKLTAEVGLIVKTSLKIEGDKSYCSWELFSQ